MIRFAGAMLSCLVSWSVSLVDGWNMLETLQILEGVLQLSSKRFLNASPPQSTGCTPAGWPLQWTKSLQIMTKSNERLVCLCILMYFVCESGLFHPGHIYPSYPFFKLVRCLALQVLWRHRNHHVTRKTTRDTQDDSATWTVELHISYVRAFNVCLCCKNRDEYTPVRQHQGVPSKVHVMCSSDRFCFHPQSEDLRRMRKESVFRGFQGSWLNESPRR